MEVQLGKADVKKALERAVRAIPRGAQDGAAGVHLAAYHQQLTVTAASETHAVMARLEAQVVDGGIAVLPAKAMLDAVKATKHKTVSITVERGRAVVAGTEIAALPPSAFRPQAVPGPYYASVESGALKQALKRTVYAAAPGWDIRPHKRAVHLQSAGGRLTVAAADEWRAACSTVVLAPYGSYTHPFTFQCAIMAETAELFVRTLPESGSADISFVGRTVFLVTPLVTICGAICDDRAQELFFPQTIPTHGAIEVERESLLTLAKAVKDNLKGELRPMILEAHGATLAVTVPVTDITKEVDESKTSGFTRAVQRTTVRHQQLCRTYGSPDPIAVNAAFLTDALAALDCTTVRLECGTKVLVIRGDEGTSLHAIATMKPQETGHDTTGHHRAGATSAAHQAI